jgi:hypothetical protein
MVVNVIGAWRCMATRGDDVPALAASSATIRHWSSTAMGDGTLICDGDCAVHREGYERG